MKNGLTEIHTINLEMNFNFYASDLAIPSCIVFLLFLQYLYLIEEWSML